MIHPEGIQDSDYKQKEELITKTRIEVIEIIYEEKGIDGIENLTNASNNPTSIGHVLHRTKYSDIFQDKITALSLHFNRI